MTGGSGGNYSQEGIEAFTKTLTAEMPLAMVAAEPIDTAYILLFDFGQIQLCHWGRGCH